MLCCLLGALLAGNFAAAWRLAVAAARRGAPVWATRALIAAVAATSLAATASLANHAASDGATPSAEAPCSAPAG